MLLWKRLSKSVNVTWEDTFESIKYKILDLPCVCVTRQNARLCDPTKLILDNILFGFLHDRLCFAVIMVKDLSVDSVCSRQAEPIGNSWTS